jgi:hypothetical protein
LSFECPGCGRKGDIEISMKEGKAPRVKKEKKPEEEPAPFFKEMVGHLDHAWLNKKKAKFHWEGRFFRDLKVLARTYTPFGVMALFDLFLTSEDPWVKSTGHSFPAFISSLPKLLDTSNWKALSRKYEAHFMPETDNAVAAIAAGMIKVGDPKK